MAWFVCGIDCVTVCFVWMVSGCVYVLVNFYLLCVCVWKYFEIDFVWRGVCLLRICWTRIMQIETIYYNIAVFVCYYVYKIILLFWGGVVIKLGGFGVKKYGKYALFCG